MLDWDYEVDCPKCGETYSGEVSNSTGKDRQEITCDECETKFIVKATAYIEIEVDTEIIK